MWKGTLSWIGSEQAFVNTVMKERQVLLNQLGKSEVLKSAP